MVEPNSAAVVAVATLNVREHPGTAARLTGTLAKGDVVFVYAYGPTVVDGYDWFQASQVKGLHDQLPALPDAPLSGDWSGTSGWIAVATTTATYVTALAPRCPTTFDLRTIQAMLPGEQLSCLGGRTLTLEGTYGCPGCGGAIAGVFSPQWLAFPQSWDFISVNVADRIGPFAVRFPPDVPRPAAASVVRVRGHFDDPRASSCSIALSSASDSPLVAVPPDQAMLVCRQHFVVTDYEVIGTDPSFPPF
jgi:hypothetical protein